MRTLIIDDDIEIQQFLKVNLEAECHAVDVAGDGHKGSYLARTNDYDLVILDNMLPHKCGAEVVSEIRNSGKEVPIIMLSVQKSTSEKIEILNRGADDYLTKPFSYEELRARIKAVLRRPKPMKAETLKLGDLMLDPSRQKAFRGQKEIYLTRKEFTLAEYLMKNRGSVVSRGMIMEHVWNANTDPFSNTIEAHILNLRKKIDRTNKSKLIRTVPGRGYMMEV